MSGYCPDCGNTLCECDEVTRATYPYRMRVLELERELAVKSNKASNEERMRAFYVEKVMAMEKRLAEAEVPTGLHDHT